jgi:hypothetical protein
MATVSLHWNDCVHFCHSLLLRSHFGQTNTLLLTSGEKNSFFGYAQHLCLLLGISHFNAGALVFCDGSNKQKLTRDTEYSEVLQDTNLTRLHNAKYCSDRIDVFITLTALLWLLVLFNMIDADEYRNRVSPALLRLQLLPVSRINTYFAYSHFVEQDNLGGISSGFALSFDIVIHIMLLISDDITLGRWHLD